MRIYIKSVAWNQITIGFQYVVFNKSVNSRKQHGPFHSYILLLHAYTSGKQGRGTVDIPINYKASTRTAIRNNLWNK